MNDIAEEIKHYQLIAICPGMTAHTTTDAAVGVLARRLGEALDRIDRLEIQVKKLREKVKK